VGKGPDKEKSDGEAAWWLEQRKRKKLVAATCARLGTGWAANKADFMYSRANRLLYCRNAKVAEHSHSLTISHSD
jgi:hypothetical protein